MKTIEHKRRLLPMLYGDTTTESIVKLCRDESEPLNKRRAAFGLLDQEYRNKINLKYPTE